IEGFPMGVFVDVVPVFLRVHDVSNTAIGLVSGLSWAWSLKMFWSPLVDRYGDPRHWIAAALCAMAAALALVGIAPSGTLGPALIALIALYCVFSATQDIAIDGYTIGLTPRGAEGPVTSVRNAAYRIGSLASGMGLLLLPAWIGWAGTFTAAAVAKLAMAGSVAGVCPPPPLASSQRQPLCPAPLRSLPQPATPARRPFLPLYPGRY